MAEMQPKLKVDVNHNPTKKGIKVQFILPQALEGDAKATMVQKLQSKLHLANRINNAGRPAYGPSPCSVKNILVTYRLSAGASLKYFFPMISLVPNIIVPFQKYLTTYKVFQFLPFLPLQDFPKIQCLVLA